MTDLTAAKTILAQLGGNRFRGMTGANSFAGDDNSLSFKLPSRMTQDHIRGVKIVLDSLDLYDVTYYKMAGSFKRGNLRVETVAESHGLYADMLRSDFTEKTGLETSLGTCGATEKREG